MPCLRADAVEEYLPKTDSDGIVGIPSEARECTDVATYNDGTTSAFAITGRLDTKMVAAFSGTDMKDKIDLQIDAASAFASVVQLGQQNKNPTIYQPI